MFKEMVFIWVIRDVKLTLFKLVNLFLLFKNDSFLRVKLLSINTKYEGDLKSFQPKKDTIYFLFKFIFIIRLGVRTGD